MKELIRITIIKKIQNQIQILNNPAQKEKGILNSYMI